MLNLLSEATASVPDVTHTSTVCVMRHPSVSLQSVCFLEPWLSTCSHPSVSHTDSPPMSYPAVSPADRTFPVAPQALGRRD